MSLLDERNRWIAKCVAEEIRRYFNGEEYKRKCATCGAKFSPVHRWHFFCVAQCRKVWYRGQFRPHNLVSSSATRKKRAA